MAPASSLFRPSAPHPVARTKTLFFGDSITVGEGLLRPEEERWTALVAAARGWTEVNEGRGGRPSSAWDEFCAVFEARKSDPDIDRFVVALGGNDARDAAPDIAVQVARNVGRMIDRVRQEAPAWAIVVGGPYNINRLHLQKKEIADLREKNLLAIEGTVRAMTQAKGCPFVPFLGAIPPEALTADGVHPDAAGHLALAFIFLASFHSQLIFKPQVNSPRL